MSIWQWMPKESELSEGGMTIFRHQLLQFLIAVSFMGAFFLIPWVVTPSGPTMAKTSTVLYGIFLAGITYLLRPNLPIFTSWFYVVGSLGWFVFLVVNFPSGTFFALLPIPTLLAGLLLGPWSGFVIGLASSFLVVWLHPTLYGVDMTLFGFAVIVIVGGIGMIAGNSLAQVDYWERSLVLEQRKSIIELQKHQGELARVVKELGQTTERLARANTELSIARRLADEARAMKEHFAANISHELRTPLNIIVGFAEMMYLSPESYPDVRWSPALQGDIQELYRASQHLQSLVNDVLDLARINAVQMPMFREMQDICEIIYGAVETITPLIEQHGLTCDVHCPPNLPPLYIDRTRIRQVMINLLNNAVRFTDSGGITVEVKQDDGFLIVKVADTGIGIPTEQLEKIFDEFTQAETGLSRRGGTGLGLTLSKRFVNMHGGRMWAESQVGVGSTFYFSLPLPGATLQPTRLRRTPMRHQVDLSHAPIVLVDADPSLADMLRRYLNDRPVIGIGDNFDGQVFLTPVLQHLVTSIRRKSLHRRQHAHSDPL